MQTKGSGRTRAEMISYLENQARLEPGEGVSVVSILNWARIQAKKASQDVST
jgi:hypothetical protein